MPRKSKTHTIPRTLQFDTEPHYLLSRPTQDLHKTIAHVTFRGTFAFKVTIT